MYVSADACMASQLVSLRVVQALQVGGRVRWVGGVDWWMDGGGIVKHTRVQTVHTQPRRS